MTELNPTNVLFPEFRRRKADCQNERSSNPLLESQLRGSCAKLGKGPFLVVRTKAADVAAALRREAEEEARACEEHMMKEAKLHATLCSHAKTAHYLRCLANRIEMDARDGA